MIYPIRCFSCNKILHTKVYKDFEKCESKKGNVDNVFKKHNIKRSCCKRMIITHINIIDDLLLYPTNQ